VCIVDTVSFALFVALLVLVARHRFSDSPDSGVVTLILLLAVLVSGVCVTAAPGSASLAPVTIQVGCLAAAVFLDRRTHQVVSWLDRGGELVEQWWSQRQR
jgi:uncharacterized membrane protein (DUF4010 family)